MHIVKFAHPMFDAPDIVVWNNGSNTSENIQMSRPVRGYGHGVSARGEYMLIGFPYSLYIYGKGIMFSRKSRMLLAANCSPLSTKTLPIC